MPPVNFPSLLKHLNSKWNLSIVTSVLNFEFLLNKICFIYIYKPAECKSACVLQAEFNIKITTKFTFQMAQ